MGCSCPAKPPCWKTECVKYLVSDVSLWIPELEGVGKELVVGDHLKTPWIGDVVVHHRACGGGVEATRRSRYSKKARVSQFGEVFEWSSLRISQVGSNSISKE